MEGRIWYLCDGEKPDCPKTYCYKKTDVEPCRHTSDIEHAANFTKKETGERISYWEATAVPETTQSLKGLGNKF